MYSTHRFISHRGTSLAFRRNGGASSCVVPNPMSSCCSEPLNDFASLTAFGVVIVCDATLVSLAMGGWNASEDEDEEELTE